jgi:hypothetical protein
VKNVVSVSYIIIQPAYNLCVLTSILLSVSLTDICTADKSDAGVVSRLRRRFLDWYGFRFSTTL